ncbi:hypothetical protein KOR34_02260 [Posidoniimonas corsicana]|uniref:Uncharacterized protein n=1 Tax=Posidoniimonas corsicana TaxID=1938618 RepID=A0A5C5V9Q1_9BACT|nr:hypothetical protein [Posidoniimonas corsicana]TWT35336.1 hypothetical protein KOR34_02260 [Posidoniimonas corsicana]
MSDDDRKEIIRNTCALESLTATVKQLHADLEAVKIDRQRDNEALAAERIAVGVLAEKVDRISWVVYGTAAAIGLQTLTLAGGLAAYLLTAQVP